MICHDRTNIAASVVTTVTTLPTTLERVDVNACWAPCTSELRRVTRAPVWARLKKPIGIRWTWSNTWVRRSWIRPSPMRAENQRWARPIAAGHDGEDADERGEADDEAGALLLRCPGR